MKTLVDKNGEKVATLGTFSGDECRYVKIYPPHVEKVKRLLFLRGSPRKVWTKRYHPRVYLHPIHYSLKTFMADLQLKLVYSVE